MFNSLKIINILRNTNINFGKANVNPLKLMCSIYYRYKLFYIFKNKI